MGCNRLAEDDVYLRNLSLTFGQGNWRRQRVYRNRRYTLCRLHGVNSSTLKFIKTIILSFIKTIILRFIKTIILSFIKTIILRFIKTIILRFIKTIILRFIKTIILRFIKTIILPVENHNNKLFCGHNVNCVNLEAGGTYGNHSALKVKIQPKHTLTLRITLALVVCGQAKGCTHRKNEISAEFALF